MTAVWAGDGPAERARFRLALLAALVLEAAVIAVPSFLVPPPPRTEPVRGVEQARLVTLPPVAPPPVAPPKKAPRPRVPVHRVARPLPRVKRAPLPLPPVTQAPAPTAAPEAPPQPAAPPLPAPAPNVPAPDDARLISRYAASLRALIQAQLTVPESVRALGLDGDTVIQFRLAPSGQLLSARVVSSSGIPPIDRAALADVKSLRYPPFPPTLPAVATTFSVLVHLSAAASGR